MLEQRKQNKERQSLVLILALGFLLRLFLAAATEGYVYDINCFFAWGDRMAEVGARGFYAEDYFCDYPPAYLYLLGLVSQLMQLFQLHFQQKVAQCILVFVPALADLGLGLVLYHVAAVQGRKRLGMRLAAFVAFCPMFWFDTAVWKQIDSLPALLLVLCFYLLSRQKYLPAAFLYGLALAIKPQALMLGPVLALCFLWPVFFAKEIKAFWRAIASGALGVLAALVPLYLTALPFFGLGNTTQSLLALYTSTASSYPYAGVNAFHFMAACGGNWVEQSAPFTLSLFGKSISLFFTWETFGTIAIFAASVFVVWLAYRAHKNNRFSPVFLAAVYMITLFTFAHRMHERYLLLGVALLLCAVAQFGSARLLSIAGGLSLTALFNMAVVYTVVETEDSFLTSATSTLTMRVVGTLETLLCILLLYQAWRICQGAPYEEILPDAQPLVAKQSKDKRAKAKQSPAMEAFAAPAPRWSKQEKIFLLALTLVVGVVSFSYLGDFTAPQNAIDTTETPHRQVVVLDGAVDELWVYPGIIQSGATLQLTDLDGMSLLSVELPIGSLFQWQSYSIPNCEGYVITVSGFEVIEVGFRDQQGNLLGFDVAATQVYESAALLSGEGFPQTDEPSALFDEQALIPDEISQLNGFYFDEIYHARTAYESVNGLPIYEISHPPMGKNFIAFGILLFGMTGFGWRCVGALFGVLMVPVIYWLTRRLSRSALTAGFVALLLSCDFMRYTQSRIATIDTISAFFILLSATCMVWYCQSVLEKGVRKSILPMALAGLAFGFGAASKWTGLYAGVGLAILYFGVLVVRYCQQVHLQNQVVYPATKQNDKKQNKKHQNNQSVAHSAPAQATVQTVRGMQAFCKECQIALLGGVAFFVFVPFIIYLVSYLPYWLADSSFGWMDWWQNQDYMYWYHSTLDATHPFSSSWYSWVLDLRPVWYYMGSGLPEGSYASIAGFYNPILCWVGLAAWLRLALRALQGKGSWVGNALIVLLLSQFLPWLLVTRCTFLYHYFPSFLFTVVAIGLWFQALHAQNEGRANTLALGLLGLAALSFVWFYPVLSGLPVGELWAQSLHILPSYGFYIIS